MENWKNLLKVTLQHEMYSGVVPNRFITYKTNSISLSDSQYSEIMDSLPNQWSSENDKILRFNVAIDDNGETRYYLEMQKNAYDFRIREYKKMYYVREPSVEECEFLYTIFKDFYTKYKLEGYTNFYNDILESIGNSSLTCLKIKQIRDDLLKESDVYMLVDYPISEEERNEWKEYRQKLRDLTTQSAWPDDITNIEIPVAPASSSKDQLKVIMKYLNISSELFNEFGIGLIESKSNELVKNFVSVSTKMEVLNSLSKLNIPLFTEGGLTAEKVAEQLNEMKTIVSLVEAEKILENEEFSDSNLAFMKYSTVVDQMNEKINIINEKLKEYEINFTIDDIIKDILKTREIQEQAEQILELL